MSAANPLSTIRKRRTAADRTLTPTTCRYIARPAINLDVSNAEILDALGPSAANASSAQEVYRRALAADLFGGRSNRVLTVHDATTTPNDATAAALPSLSAAFRRAAAPPRWVAQSPIRILDAPELVDDYYLNLLDWSSADVLAVALNASIYLWDAPTGAIKQLLDLSTRVLPDHECHPTSLKWRPSGDALAFGTSDGHVELATVERFSVPKALRTLDAERAPARVGSLAWNGAHVLSAGDRAGVVRTFDVRLPTASACVGRLHGHAGEVCGLEYSKGHQLASGANDNKVCVWDARFAAPARACAAPSEAPLFEFTRHTAAVKALAWCPWRANLLASGGGTADKSICFWDTRTGACLERVDAHSQVTALLWSPHGHELLSAHGYSHNSMTLWRYPSMTKVATLTGHTSRILAAAQRPNGQEVVTAGADETLRFWKVWNDDAAAARAAPRESVFSSPLSSVR